MMLGIVARQRAAALAGAACLQHHRTAVTRALVLNKKDDLELRDIDVDEPFTADDVRIDIHKVGICGSDIHYYEVCVITVAPFYCCEGGSTLLCLCSCLCD